MEWFLRDEYTKRKPNTPKEMDTLNEERFGIIRSEMNEELLAKLPRSARFLEVGSNAGMQLNLLAGMVLESVRSGDQ